MKHTKSFFILLIAFLAMQMNVVSLYSADSTNNAIMTKANESNSLNDSIMNCDRIDFSIQWEDGSTTHHSSICFISTATNNIIEDADSLGVISIGLKIFYELEDKHYFGLKDTLLKSNFPVFDSIVVANERILYITIYENKKIIGDYTLELSTYYDIIVGILKQALSPEECEGIIKLISRKEPY